MRRRAGPTLAGLLLLAALSIGLALFVGRYPRPIWMPFELLWDDQMAQRLVLNLRLPRILSAFMVGACLSAAGVVLQMVFRNPLVSPGFLGVSQGAGFGAARKRHPSRRYGIDAWRNGAGRGRICPELRALGGAKGLEIIHQ